MFRRGIFGKIKSVSRDGIDQPLIDMIINPNHLGCGTKVSFEIPPSIILCVTVGKKLKNRQIYPFA